jgi:hypothetical protein
MQTEIKSSGLGGGNNLGPVLEESRKMKITIMTTLLLCIASFCYASGTAVSVPGVEVVTDGDGASVKLPGLNVVTDGAGSSVNVPDVKVASAGTEPVSGEKGEDTVINADDGILTVLGRGQSVTINGDNNNVVVDGFVKNIVINGDENIIDAKELASSVNMTGDKNTVLLPTPPNDASVQLVDLGEYNKLQYR